jgi:hypothetical protein
MNNLTPLGISLGIARLFLAIISTAFNFHLRDQQAETTQFSGEIAK